MIFFAVQVRTIAAAVKHYERNTMLARPPAAAGTAGPGPGRPSRAAILTVDYADDEWVQAVVRYNFPPARVPAAEGTNGGTRDGSSAASTVETRSLLRPSA